MRLSRPLLLIYATGFLRALGVGMLGVVLGVYLSRVGVNATRIGLVVAAGIAGMSVATASVSWAAHRSGCRLTLVVLSLLTGLGGVALAVVPSMPALLLLAFVGMLNGTGTDRSAAFALEQAIIPGARSGSWAHLGVVLVQRPAGWRRGPGRAWCRSARSDSSRRAC